MAYSANNTKLLYKKQDASEFMPIPYLMEVPEFGGTPEKIDITTLSDKVKRYMPGIKDYGDLVFKFLYESGVGSNYSMLKGLADVDEAAAFKIEYPDGSAHEFYAIPAVKMDAAAINDVLTFSATMILLPPEPAGNRFITKDGLDFITKSGEVFIVKEGAV